MTSLLSSFLLAVAVATAQVAVPPLKARVTDLTGTLNAQQRGALEQTLAEFESRKGSQIAVLLVPTTQPETPVEYGVRVFDSWKLGRKGVDDGVLLLVAKEDRRVWIVTGRGVEGVLPDAIVRRIVEQDITPRFKQGDFYGGVRAGADRMMRLIEGESLPAAQPRGEVPVGDSDVLQWFIIAVFAAVFGGPVAKAFFGRVPGAGILGGSLGAIAWFVLGSLLLAGLVGFISFLIALVIGMGGGSSRGGGGGGWSSGGWSTGCGGGWSSGGGGGGGFSGGGGGTSGGGAGGSW